MRTLMLAILLWCPTFAHAAAPALSQHHESGVYVDVPEGWTVLVKPDVHNVTMNHGIATTVTMYWYLWRPGITLDEILDILVKTVNDNIPVGEVTELSRTDVPGLAKPWGQLRGKQVTAKVDVFGYSMSVAVVAVVDETTSRITAAFLVAPPDVYTELSGMELLTDVVRSVWLDTDAPKPAPGWWYNATPPASIAAEPG